MEFNNRLLPACFAPVETAEGWLKHSRQAMLERIGREEYGFPPMGEDRISYCAEDTASRTDGVTAIRYRITCHHPAGAYSFTMRFFSRSDAKKCPCVLFVNNRDPAFTDISNTVWNPFFPLPDILGADYCAAAFNYDEVQPDDPAKTQEGIMGYRSKGTFPQDAPWGALCGWAWAASQCRKVLSALPEVDGKRIYMAGHSRGGKTALWAAAMDTAFAGVFASCSGCGGSALHRGKTGERIADIVGTFPHWFTPRFADYAGREDSLPFDQHQLLGLLAPRPLYITSASEDAWADPISEALSIAAAARFWELLGEEGLSFPHLPRVGVSYSNGCCGYHIRQGVHDLTREDWLTALAFFSRQEAAQ